MAKQIPERDPVSRSTRAGFATDTPGHVKIAGISIGFDPTNDVEVVAQTNYNVFLPKYDAAGHTAAGNALMIHEYKARVLTAFNASVTIAISDQAGAVLDSAYLAPQAEAGTGALKSNLLATTPSGGSILDDLGADIIVSIGGANVSVGQMMLWVVYSEIEQGVF